MTNDIHTYCTKGNNNKTPANLCNLPFFVRQMAKWNCVAIEKQLVLHCHIKYRKEEQKKIPTAQERKNYFPWNFWKKNCHFKWFQVCVKQFFECFVRIVDCKCNSSNNFIIIIIIISVLKRINTKLKFHRSKYVVNSEQRESTNRNSPKIAFSTKNILKPMRCLASGTWNMKQYQLK